MIVDLKETQPVEMMPGGVQFSMSWKQLIQHLRGAGEFKPDETVTHISSDLLGLTFRVARNDD